jgi:predicted nuclease of predicted toxin-antitoxin system
VKLLFDENLSSSLVSELQSEFPGSTHLDLIGMRRSEDRRIWEYAGGDDFVIVSKDNDFRQLSFVLGPPPKVIWLSVGNSGTAAILAVIKANADRIIAFEADPELGLLVLER